MSKSYVALDIGEKRIGVALARDDVKIAMAYDTLNVDGGEVQAIAEIIVREKADVLVVGYPRNQAGEPTKQTEFVERFIEQLRDIVSKIVFQDESLTSVKAEEILNARNQPYAKGEVDALAASLILQDYLETH
ncbi:Holliday junction resolvase RuvX [TM7 phylum sp. oral taxon 349]|jgi:RNAse H domain protein, YqgF family|nr:Holliday junction resolvase RuvX [TM7 phylum sp. oral taxon 349]TWP24949.1 Holliday junction resolvase RuvX [TM7 phylum sp. oral taxon 349]